MAPFHDFCVAGNDAHPCRCGGLGHLLHHGDKFAERKTFLQDEGGTQEGGLGAAHCQIVDRAVDCQVADRSAGEKQRPHDIGIGREGEPAGGNFQQRRIRELVEQPIAKGGQKDLLDQLPR